MVAEVRTLRDPRALSPGHTAPFAAGAAPPRVRIRGGLRTPRNHWDFRGAICSARGRDLAMTRGDVSSRRFLLLQLTAIAVLPLMPDDSWLLVSTRVLLGWTAALLVVLGVRRHKPAGAAAYLCFAAGMFMNVSGIFVEKVLATLDPTDTPPTWADALWLSIYPALIGGMAILIRRRGKTRDWSAVVDTTIITVGLGLLSWVFLIHPQATHIDTSLSGRAVLTAYPVGDLVVLAVMVRLLLGSGSRAPAFALMMGSLICLLWADVVWALISQMGTAPGPTLGIALSMSYQLAYALVGASALHPSVRNIAQPAPPSERLHPALLVGLAVASLIAPGLLMFETLRQRVVDGAAIAICSTVLFLLVVVRMAELVRRLGDRTRATRLVLDTVNQGLLRVDHAGIMGDERSAIVDRWFGPAQPGTRFVDHIAGLDPGFAAAFRVGHDQWCEDVMPAELCLEQMPRRLCIGPRQLSISYLPVTEAGRNSLGLLLVLDDVTEHLQLLQHEAEQRELLAVSQGFARDRAEQARFFAEVTAQLQQVAAPALDPVTHRRILHTLKGNASVVGFGVMAQLCHAAESALEGPESGEPGSLEASRVAVATALAALRARWQLLTAALHELGGDRDPEVIELRRSDLATLGDEIAGGLSAPHIIHRLWTLQGEPVARPLGRLARHARTLAQRLGKGDLRIDIDAGDIRLDAQRWGPLWAEIVHVVNNAIDHGIESVAERQATNKSERPRLRLAAFIVDVGFIIEIEDDGRGIDWEAIGRKAQARGLPAQTSGDLTAALLSAGVSSRDQVSLISGRGVGMSAVHARTRALAGEITVSSQRGQGTCWRLTFPIAALRAPSPSLARADLD
jgi:HPt (histidine-containing phosphotransfer) domain-containing protein